MAAKKPARDLTKFSSLISSLTLPALVEKALAPGMAAPSKTIAELGGFVQSSLQRAAKEAKARGVSHNAGSFPLWGGWSPTAIDKAMGLGEGSAVKEGAAALDQARAVLSTLDPVQKERAAQALSLHLCASYERQGAPGLGFALLGEGVRRSKTIQDGVAVKGAAGWRGTLRYALNPTDHQLAEEDVAEREIAQELRGDIDAMDDLNQMQQHLRYAYSTAPKEIEAVSQLRLVGQPVDSGDNVGYGKFGVDLAGKHRALGKPEAPLACVERLESALSAKAASKLTGLDLKAAREGAMLWRMFTWHNAGSALARALGDQVSLDDPRAAQALRPGYALRASCAALTARMKNAHYNHRHREGAHKESPLTEKEWGALIALYKQAPLTYCVQLAQEIGVKDTESRRPFVENELTRAALDYLKEFSAQADSLAARALQIAKERQAEWLKKEGLSDAWSSMLASEKNRLPNAKALAWALAHPETAALAADKDPKSVLSSGMARALGINGGSAEVLFAAVSERLEPMGLSPQALEWCVGNALGAALTAEAQKALPLSGREKELQQDRFALACRVTQAAFERGVAPKMALEALGVLSSPGLEGAYRSFNTSNYSFIGDNLSSSLPYRELEDVKGAEALRSQAEAKKQKLGWLVGEALERFVELKQSVKEKRVSTGAFDPDASIFEFNKSVGAPMALSREMTLLAQQPAIDWAELDPSKMKWGDVLMRRSPAMAAARREALAEGGVAGAIAAVCAAGLGIEDPQGGNDLIAKTREALKESWGLTQGGWKALLKAPGAVIEGAVGPLRDQERRGLALRSAEEKQRAAMREVSKAGAMRGVWLSAMAQYNLPPEPINQVLSFVSHSHAGFDPISDWGPYVAAQSRGSEQGAVFFIAEAKAKEQRLPHVIKALCDRYAARLKESEAEEGWRQERAWKDSSLPPEDLAKRRAASLVCQDWSLVSDWINKSEDGVWQTLPEKPTWNQLWRLQKEWHDEVAAIGAATLNAKGKANPAAIAWPSPLGRHTQGDWMAVELTNGRALAEEGREMGHCVSSYSGSCKAGEQRIFSIRFAGQRVCTLELRAKHGKSYVNFASAQEGDAWEITQNKGKHNAEVKDKAALAFCAQTAAAYTEAVEKKIIAERERVAVKAKERRAALKVTVNVGEALAAAPAPEPSAPAKPKKAKPKA